MKVYLDDDHDANVLIGLLQHARHDVISPRAVGTSGIADSEHLHYAAAHESALLTGNVEDFAALHKQWMTQQLEHSGILMVHKENNSARDMSYHQIAQAVSKIEQSGIPLANACHNLNFWR